MATRNKAEAKRQKTPAKRPIARKKTPPVKKTVAKKKPIVRGAATKKKPAPRPAQILKRQPVRAPSQPAKPAVPAAAPAPSAGEEPVGTVTHYYGDLSVAAVRMDSGSLRMGDMIHVVGRTSDFRQRVESMQVEHEPVSEVRAGQEFGLKVTDHAREHDIVYKAA
jgi:translation elongation factor EF-Tu-like GTPase